MKLLVTCPWTPLPSMGGSPLRTWGLIRAAARIAEVGVVALCRSEEELEMLRRETAGLCVFAEGVPAPRTALRKGGDLLRSLLSGRPYHLEAATEPALAAAATRAIERWQPDIVQAATVGAAPVLEEARRRGIRCVYSAHNVESRILEGPPEQPAGALARRGIERIDAAQAQAARLADAVLAVTEGEARWLGKFNSRVRVIPNAIDCAAHRWRAPSARAGGAVLFVGHLRYPPNQDAATVLAREIYPRLREARPEARLLIAGRRPGPALRALAGEGIEIVADPPDMAPIWERAAVLACPLRWGAGSRLKLLEAAAWGVPIVCTAIGAEGLALRAGDHYLRAEEPAAAAAALAGVLADPARHDAMAARARACVEAEHDIGRLVEPLGRLYRELLEAPAGTAV